MRPSLRQRLADAAEQRRGRRLERARHPGQAHPDHRLRRDRRELVNFCANDYLGLAHHPEVAGALAAAARTHGAGSGASPLVTGHHAPHAELEAALADFLGREAALVFPSGYQANLAVGQSLLGRGRRILVDRYNHASLNDGARLAGARLQRYDHANADAARDHARGAELLATDGVFSMDGDLAPLADLGRLCDDHDLPLWLDDAHGFGVLGATGRGSLEHLGLSRETADIHVITFGKALGTAGACVLGENALIEHLVNTARPLIYSTAAPPALAAATRRALEVMQAESWRREKLREHVARFRERAREHDLPLADSDTPIQPVLLGDNARTLAASEHLAGHGYAVTAIRPPTVPAGSARLRITLSAGHSPQDIDGLVETLSAWISSSNATVADPA